GGSDPSWSTTIGASTLDGSLVWVNLGPAEAEIVGIVPPTMPVAATQYSPQFLSIDSFQSASGYSPSGMSLVGLSTAASVSGINGTPVLDYEQYTDVSNSFKEAPDGMVATSTAGGSSLCLKFNTQPLLQSYDIVCQNNTYNVSDTFTFQAVTFSIASNT